MPDFSIGVDLGGTNLRIAAVSREGELLEKIALDTKLALGPGHVIGEMCDAIQRLTKKYKVTGNFLGAGIGVPGLVDVAAGIMRKAVNLPGFENYPARAEIERRLRASGVLENNTHVVLENDARLAAFGEQWIGAARGVPNMAIFTLGTGIGGGIVLNGKIWHGMNGMAGEFGHVTIEPDGVLCACGNRGCSEKYASATAIMRMAREAMDSGEAPSLAQAASSGAESGVKAIYNLALQGDEEAIRIFHTFGRYLGILLADIVNVLNLDMYVIGGGVASAWDAFAPTMFEELRKRSIVYAVTAPDDPLKSASLGKQESPAAKTESSNERKTIITLALLGSDAGLYGAARAALGGG
jgi:glucokinase